MSTITDFQIQAFACSDVGMVRTTNEDAFCVANFTEGLRLEKNGVLRFLSGQLGSLFAVADGMGGAAAGEVASKIGLRSVYREMQEQLWDGPPDEEGLEQILIDAVGFANSEIYEMSNRDHRLEGMGTTLTIALEFCGRLLVGQVGDSRAYLLRKDGIRRLTRDQSLVAQKVSAGELTGEEARHHPKRNILLQALGVEPRVELNLSRMTLQPRDILLLCSDGLHSLMNDDEIYDVVVESSHIEDACPRLIDSANRRGGPDNITVVLAQFLP